MLPKNTSSPNADYLENWPKHYYELETAAERLAALDSAGAQGLSTPADACRRALLMHRFFSAGKSGTVDGFVRAWTMIKASAAAGVPLLQKKSKRRELETYMRDLCLSDFQPDAAVCQEVLAAEWQDFAGRYICACAGNKSYCSTIFGLVPMKDSTVAEKIAAELVLVTRDYPALLGCADAFLPLHQIMCDTYCHMIENGDHYLSCDSR